MLSSSVSRPSVAAGGADTLWTLLGIVEHCRGYKKVDGSVSEPSSLSKQLKLTRQSERIEHESKREKSTRSLAIESAVLALWYHGERAVIMHEPLIENAQTVTKWCLHGPSNQMLTQKSDKHT